MNPGMLFDEVLESHEFRPSDKFRPSDSRVIFSVLERISG